jgi:uroporphyrinogen III methyltransferase/synthase
VDVLALYETLAEPLPASAREQAQRADYITFTSSSTVRFFLDAFGDTPARGRGSQTGAAEPAGTLLSPATRIASIGPVTSATLREHGLEPDVEARSHDIDGLVDALLADALAHPG